MSAVKDFILIAKDVGQIATDLFKVQADQLVNTYKQLLIHVLTWVLVLLAALLLAIGGLGLIVWGIYLQLSLVAGPVVSAFVLGVFLLFGAAILYLLARGMLND